MSNRTGPTAQEEAEFPFNPHAEAIDWEVTKRGGGGPWVSFSPEQLDNLFAACDLVGEDSVSFVRNAALARAEVILSRERSDTPAAGGS